MKKYVFPILTFLFLLICTVSAKKTLVTTASAINSGNWQSGDTILMKNGTWNNQSISFKGIGTQVSPVVLMAETAGSVILNGSSKIGFSGSYVEINGLYFKDGTLSGSDIISFRTSSSNTAENCKLINTSIENYNPSLNTVDSKWVSLYGKNNTVDHCSFVNKNNSGTLLVVWLTSGETPSHTISNNYFGYRNSNLDTDGNELNGQEIIRIGDSSTSMTTAACIVSGNFFEKCNGEIEVISNKSCGNLYKNNLFLECNGMLTLRHGNSCTVDGNYFFGNGASESGGVRIIGENHKVYNNYFENLRGTNYRSGICIVRGKENSALNEYFQVKNATVVFNTFVNCSQAFSINYNSSSSLTLPPIGTTIAHNHVYNTTSSSRKNVNISTVSLASMDVSWKNNLMNQGTYTNFSFTAEQVITAKDAKMTLAETPINMYEPSTGTALTNYITTEYIDITKDIRGRDRANAKLPGASQLSGTTTEEMPIKTTVGAAFYNNPSTGNIDLKSTTLFKIKLQNNKLNIESLSAGNLKVYDLKSKVVVNKNIESTENSVIALAKGIYIVLFDSNTGQKQTNKILIK